MVCTEGTGCPAGTGHLNDVVMTSMRRNDVASTSIRRHFHSVPAWWDHHAYTLFLSLHPIEDYEHMYKVHPTICGPWGIRLITKSLSLTWERKKTPVFLLRADPQLVVLFCVHGQPLYGNVGTVSYLTTLFLGRLTPQRLTSTPCTYCRQ